MTNPKPDSVDTNTFPSFDIDYPKTATQSCPFCSIKHDIFTPFDKVEIFYCPNKNVIGRTTTDVYYGFNKNTK